MRTDPQNKCFHGWCAITADHLRNCNLWLCGEPRKVIKQMVKEMFGNGGKAGDMSTRNYPRTPLETTYEEQRMGIVSMSEMLSQFEAWAATDLNLLLPRNDLLPDDKAKAQAA